jgi:Fe-S oxidoreductase
MVDGDIVLDIELFRLQTPSLPGLASPANTTYWLLPGRLLFLLIPLLGVALFTYIILKRLRPLLEATPDDRFDRPLTRLARIFKYWVAQWKQPRYMAAGVLHIVIFAGFLVLSIRSISLVLMGIFQHFQGLTGGVGEVYNIAKDYAATLVFIAVVIAAIRRGIVKPARYAVPAKYGKDHTAEALIVLGLIGTLMVSESLFEASAAAVQAHTGLGADTAAPFSLAWVLTAALGSTSFAALSILHQGAYLVHDLTFFSFLCFLPLGKHFHVITSFFNVYFAKLDRRGTVKPVRWGVPDEQLDQVKSFGVKTFTDFTWKQMLDFYSCADCGRCSDQCPANAVGRPLSPRFVTIKARNYSFEHYPLLGNSSHALPALAGEHGQDGRATPLIGTIYSEDEVWSCTTCGACEEECPLLVEYVDKIVDLRRGLIDDGNVPQSLQKALKALESRGNPYGKPDKKRADWTKAKGFKETCEVKVLDGKNGNADVQTLYFVDSVTSYDDRIQSIGQATARILDHVGEHFGILGAAEKDSGNEVRRFGEETLFMALRDQNTEAIKASGAKQIVTNDPHALNALKHDYKDLPPVEHISQMIAREVKNGRIRLAPVDNGKDVYTYHDPCYLGRHNQCYDDPREVLDAIPGLKRVEMSRCRDRSFCCGGGGLALFYEPKEDQRMGVKRVQMAAEAGANVIVTACPFCMVNIEDAIKVAGLEGKMTAIDLAELVDQQLIRKSNPQITQIRQIQSASNGGSQ